MSVDMSPDAITERLRSASALADLSPETRLEAKIDMGAQAITARLKEAAALLEVCLALGRSRPGQPNDSRSA